MVNLLGTAAADSLGGFFRWRRKKAHAVPVGTPCANCATPLLGPWCYACGQLGEDFHRSIGHLVMEAFEGLLHFDGRIWTTIPDLIRRPGRLTRQYLDGHRAPQIPPLRLFLVVLLLVFSIGSVTGLGGVKFQGVPKDQLGKPGAAAKAVPLDHMTPEQKEKVKAELSKLKVSINGKPDDKASSWLQQRLGHVMENPETFKLVLEQWSERFAFLMLPIASALLSLLFVFQRRFYVFDHTIFALHSLSFQGLLLSVLFLLNPLGDWTNFLAFAAPVHLFLHMRGVYGTGVFGTLIRMLLLGFGSLFGFIFLMLGLLWVGLNAMGAG
ncbi:hypothetical protein BH09PSE2_BH09PSE2_05110 [soil metagenome]